MFFKILNKIHVHRDNVWYKSNHVAKNHKNPQRNDVSMDDFVSWVNPTFVYFLLYIFGKCLITTDLTLNTISAVETSFLKEF